MSNELWTVGTWVADLMDGRATLVEGHEEDHAGQIYMDLTRYGFEPRDTLAYNKQGYVEIPPRPDVQALREQGYRLTGKAADCSKFDREREVIWAHAKYVYHSDPEYPRTADRSMWKGWRWLVERIEEEERPGLQEAMWPTDHIENEEKPVCKPSSPWIDASERAPDTARHVLCKLTWHDGDIMFAVGFYLGHAGMWRTTSDMLDSVELDQSLYRIQWMDIPE